MVDRVAVGRIVAGHGGDRHVVPAGTRFNTDTIGLDERDVRRMEQSGILRRPRDDTRPAPAVPGPGATAEEEPPGGGEGDGDEGDDKESAPRRGRARSKPSDLDL